MRKIAVHPKSVVLVLNKREAAAIARIASVYLVQGKDSRNIVTKLTDALEEIGEDPILYGLEK